MSYSNKKVFVLSGYNRLKNDKKNILNNLKQPVRLGRVLFRHNGLTHELDALFDELTSSRGDAEDGDRVANLEGIIPDSAFPDEPGSATGRYVRILEHEVGLVL